MFWCFTGILTSLIAIQIEEPPLKSLNDLQSKSNFKLLTFGGGSTDKRLKKWAEETENLKSYERSIKAISGFTKEHFEEAKNPNVAIILEDFGIKTWLEKCNMSKGPSINHVGPFSRIYDPPSLPLSGQATHCWYIEPRNREKSLTLI